MADRKGASGSNDTSFRRTWDRDEYAAKASVREANLKEEGKAKYEAAIAGKKYVRRASPPGDTHSTEARQARLNVGDQVGKTTIVAAGTSQGKRGKGAGFYCDACDLTYKDNLQFVEHLNSKQHLVATGESGEVRVAGLEEVKERFEMLVAKRKAEVEAEAVGVDLGKRIEVATAREDEERAEKRRKRNEKRRRTEGGVGHVEVKVEGDGVIC